MSVTDFYREELIVPIKCSRKSAETWILILKIAMSFWVVLEKQQWPQNLIQEESLYSLLWCLSLPCSSSIIAEDWWRGRIETCLWKLVVWWIDISASKSLHKNKMDLYYIRPFSVEKIFAKLLYWTHRLQRFY